MQVTLAEPRKFSLEWWRSDAALYFRLAELTARMLHSSGIYACAPYVSMDGAPEFPALWFYDADTDIPYWTEVKYQVHANDYMRAYPERMNSVAIILAKGLK